MKKKLLILGVNGGSIEIIKYAKSRGVYTIVTDNIPYELSIGKQMADAYWMISTADLDELEQKAREEQVDGVISGPSDFNVGQTIQLCKRLGLPCYCSEESWRYSRDKRAFKEICKKHNVPLARDYKVSIMPTESELASIQYPVMVKPIDLWGNRGVSYCYNREDVLKACEQIRILSDKSEIIVERMLFGEEWYGYYAMADGEISLVALNSMMSQPGEPKNCYSITTTVSDYVKRYCKEVNPVIEDVLKDIGCKEGIAWVQAMLDRDGHFYVIEMGYRLDGDMMYVPYKELCNFDSIAWLTDLALGEKHHADELPAPQKSAFEKCACAYMLWTNKDGIIKKISGIDQVEKLKGVSVYLNVEEGDEVSQYASMGNIMFVAENCEKLCKIIQKVNQMISVENQNDENILIYYTDYQYLMQTYENGLWE